MEHCANLQLDARPRAGSARPLTSWCTCPRPTTSTTHCTAALRETHGQDVLHRAAKRSGDFGAHFQAPGLPNQTAGTVDVYGLQILDATLEAGNTAEEEDTAASALLLKHEFLGGGADDVTLATLGKALLEPTSFAVGGFQLEGYAMTLSAFAWNIVRTYTLTPGRRNSFGCRHRLGTASNLVMYVSAADNDYVGVTGAFLGTASQGRAWTSRCRRAELRSCTSEPSAAPSPGWCSSRRARWTCTACRSGPRPSRESRSP